jgi:hypothetical protein
LLSTSYNILSNILLSKLIPYADRITGDHQCGFWRNRSTTDQFFYIHQILVKEVAVYWYIASAIYRFKKLIPLGGKHNTIFSVIFKYPGNFLSDMFPMQNCLKRG